MCSSPSGVEQLSGARSVAVVRVRARARGAQYEVRAGAGGALVLTAREDASPSPLEVLLAGTTRRRALHLHDAHQHLVVSLRRPSSLGNSKMEVWVCGEVVSVVRQEMTLLKPVLSVNDATGRPVLRVKGRAAAWARAAHTYDVQAAERRGRERARVGTIDREGAPPHDTYRLTFPRDLHVHYKAALIGTAILIDFLYFEKS